MHRLVKGWELWIYDLSNIVGWMMFIHNETCVDVGDL